MDAMKQKKELDQHTFFAGLMLGLRRHRDTFEAEGDEFYRAFLSTVKKVREDDQVCLKGVRWIRMDPVFGVVPEANDMVLEAEHDRLLALLNPRLRKARFTIRKEEAENQLRKLDPEWAEWFAELAGFFHDQLPVIV